MEYVLFKNKKYPVLNFRLDLNGLGIQNIKDFSNLGNLKTVKELDLHNNNITIISGLEKLSSLQTLYLQGNKITEIGGLDTLENLGYLYLSNNKIKDITRLTNLKNLKILNLEFNEIENISGLESLTNLAFLNLSKNKISKITGLDSLKNLGTLYLNHNEIEKIENISELFNLILIDLSSNPISEITGFENLTNLKYIKLNNTKIQKEFFDKLGGLIKGTEGIQVNEPQNLMKYCQGNYVEYKGKFHYSAEKRLKLNNLEIEDIGDIKRLQELSYLEYLELRGNKIKEIKCLDSLINVKSLYLSNNHIENIDNLNQLIKLEILALNGNQINQIKNLEKLQNLEHLNLSNNKIQEIENLKDLHNLKELALSGNKIRTISNLEELSRLEKLHLSDNQLSEVQGLDNLNNLKMISLSNNRITSIQGIEKLSNLEVLNLSNNSISKIENLNHLINLRELLLANNQIKVVEGLQNLTQLKNINLENNKIQPDLFELLKLSDYNPRIFVSFCILEPIIENMKDRILWAELINEYPYIKGINYDQLREISNQFRYVEVQISNNYEIQAILTPECLTIEFDKLLQFLREDEDLNYTFIKEKLNLIDEICAKELSLYILNNKLSEFSLYESEKGIRKVRKELLRHQLAIFDTLNQKYFFNKILFRSRMKQIENFLLSKKNPNCQIYKFAFVTDEVVRKNNTSINFLEKDSEWNLIYISKDEKSTDIDAKLVSFVNEINNLYAKEWDKVYLITLDRDLINSFLTTFRTSPKTELYFITQPDDDLLELKSGLNKYEEHDFDINIFYRT